MACYLHDWAFTTKDIRRKYIRNQHNLTVPVAKSAQT